MPVRTKLTPAAATSARAFRPSGVEAPGAGPFESTIGKSGDPSTRRAPAGPIVTVLMGGKVATAVSALRMEAEISRRQFLRYLRLGLEIQCASHRELRSACTIPGTM